MPDEPAPADPVSSDTALSALTPEARAFVEVLAVQDGAGAAAVHRARAITAIVAGLTDYDDIRRGAFLFPLLEAQKIDEPRAIALFGTSAHQVATELLRLGSLGVSVSGKPSPQQAEALRKMLLAIITDPRLVLIKLAAVLHQLRESRDAPPSERERIARETREIYAPLANRLGVWQLKWELEDWSFRYLDPDNYKRIAGLLATKRVDREKYIEDTIQTIRDELAKAGIPCDVAGRPKHIFSIWRKMQRKGLSFEQLYDIRAVRVLVDSIADCYAALGIVHSLWPYIPGEFDDYIATPKDNLYRSLHTAVIGPGKLPVEIQIRTREMHDHAELGVAAHWRYKEGGKANPAYEQKILWLRQVLEPTDREGNDADNDTGDDFLERVRSEIFEDRVYALSPRGEVIELPRGATPLDFAYHVHTELGHRCRGAKVNGRMVPLTHILSNGDQVEIITAKQSNPSRDWLVPSLGYLASQRNRSKVRAWFRKQDEDQNRQQGKQLLERELQRLAIHSVTLEELVAEFKLEAAEQLYLAVGEGEITIAQITGAIQRRTQPQELPSIVPKRQPTATTRQSSGITVDGVDDLLSHLARCCGPVPPEAIQGYITLGRGVSIHRQDCSNLKRLALDHPERVIPVDWGSAEDRSFPVEVNVRAFDRRGLVRDISSVLADSKINIHAMNTVTDAGDGIADMNLKVTVHDLQELSQVLTRIQGLPNVLSARRRS
jgi:GTP pyrophosphokinase